MSVTRRQLLFASGGITIVSLAGCTRGEDNQFSGDGTESSAAEDDGIKNSTAEDNGTENSTAEDNGTESPAARIELTVEVAGPNGKEVFFEENDIAAVGSVIDNQDSNYGLTVRLTEAGTEQATDAFRETGAADAPEDAELIHTYEGETEAPQTFSITPSFAEVIDSGEWDGVFRLSFNEREQAETVKEALEDR